MSGPDQAPISKKTAPGFRGCCRELQLPGALWLLVVLESYRLQCVNDSLPKEAVLAGVALASCRQWAAWHVRSLGDCIRRRTWLIIRARLQDSLDLLRRHVRFVLVAASEVAILADDQRSHTGGVRCRHRGTLDPSIEIARSGISGAYALLGQLV